MIAYMIYDRFWYTKVGLILAIMMRSGSTLMMNILLSKRKT